MGLLTLDRICNILLIGIPSLILAEFGHFIGLGCCCSMFVLVWGVSAVAYLAMCSLKHSPEGKAILITGCDTGFGYESALYLHKLGFTVFAACLLADKNGEGAKSLKELESPRMHVLQLDVTSEEQTKDARRKVDEVLKNDQFLVFWGIVNNAGLSAFGDLELVPVKVCKRLADVNIFGMINVIQVFLPLIRRSKGRVINVASMLGRMSPVLRSSYVLTKFAVEGLSDCLRQEMMDFGVDVIVVEPGNFIAGTAIFTPEAIEKLGEEMWSSMSEETKADYGEEKFSKKIEIMKTYCSVGDPDLTQVVETFADALLQKYPQPRYQPMDLYYKTRIFCSWHLPEWLYDFLYNGPLQR